MQFKMFKEFMKFLFVNPYKEWFDSVKKPKFLFYFILIIIAVYLIRGLRVPIPIIIMFFLFWVRYEWSIFYGEYRHKEKERQRENPPIQRNI